MKTAEAKRGPYYLEIADRLRREILTDFQPGERFYSIRDLIRRTNRSLPTVRSAINFLVEEKLLSSQPGSGYYVTRKANDHRFKDIKQLLIVIPSYVEPNEPIFTGQIISGVIHAAEHRDTAVTVYRRKAVAPHHYDKESSERDLENILAARPNAIAWLHVSPFDMPILKELKRRGIPLVTTIRKLPEFDLPLLREDDLVYASIVLSQFHARGHARIGMVIRDPDSDEYFLSKIAALRKVAATLNVSVKQSDCFVLKSDLVQVEKATAEFKQFLEEREDLKALLLLATNSIKPVVDLMNSTLRERLSKMSIVLNLLDGVKIPPLPTGESLATITPPLEELGKQLGNLLMAQTSGKQPESLDPLIPIYRPGESMKAYIR